MEFLKKKWFLNILNFSWPLFGILHFSIFWYLWHSQLFSGFFSTFWIYSVNFWTVSIFFGHFFDIDDYFWVLQFIFKLQELFPKILKFCNVSTIKKKLCPFFVHNFSIFKAINSKWWKFSPQFTSEIPLNFIWKIKTTNGWKISKSANGVKTWQQVTAGLVYRTRRRTRETGRGRGVNNLVRKPWRGFFFWLEPRNAALPTQNNSNSQRKNANWFNSLILKERKESHCITEFLIPLPENHYPIFFFFFFEKIPKLRCLFLFLFFTWDSFQHVRLSHSEEKNNKIQAFQRMPQPWITTSDGRADIREPTT